MTEEIEMLNLRAQAAAWIDGLTTAGIEENAAIAAINLAMVERSLLRGGVEQTADWLRATAAMIEANGADLLTELRGQWH